MFAVLKNPTYSFVFAIAFTKKHGFLLVKNAFYYLRKTIHIINTAVLGSDKALQCKRIFITFKKTLKMQKYIYLSLTFLILSFLKVHGQVREIKGITDSVEILRDQWGINHIYAENQTDLFFAQGYAAAKDRLFQFEIWRRQATGTVAEILGEREFKRDLGTRLFKFRGDITEEMNHYHEDGAEIITAYTNGVNAYIEEVLKTPEALPIEFKMLKILPQKWDPEVVISRHQGLLGNIGQELATGRAVAKLGAEKVKELLWFHPQDPELKLDEKIDGALLEAPILELYEAFRKPVTFNPEDIETEYQRTTAQIALTTLPKEIEDSLSIGSNNWVVSGERTEDGNTYMANDPHRTIAGPSLRYMAHLVAPGWNVIGGGEPEIPGISIGHNEYGAWGLTVYRTDGEDLYVYDLNPENQNQYQYKGAWMDMKIISETIKIKGMPDKSVRLQYSHHGPVVYTDSENNKAYAVRSASLEPGGSPYLASLRMDQAKNWGEFRIACHYSNIPGENMIWADRKGNIGWQAVGIAPIRENFSGLVPVPGDGSYEWKDYLPILEKPNSFNPESGFIATANQNVTPADYQHWNAVGFSWSDPYRGDRVNDVLSSNDKMTLEQMKALQVDYLSLPAKTLVPYLDALSLKGSLKKARKQIMDWDFKLEATSIAAAIYVAWENAIKEMAQEKFVPDSAKDIIKSLQLKTIIDWINEPDERFGAAPFADRDAFLIETFGRGVTFLQEQLGDDMQQWQYGQDKLKHTYIKHPLSDAVREDLREQLDFGPLPRGGNAYTPGSTGSNYQQSSGASFRMIVNTGDWDAAVGTNSPGQSGDPKSPFYRNLFKSWAEDSYFPIYYSREKIEANSVSKMILKPLP